MERGLEQFFLGEDLFFRENVIQKREAILTIL